jgi:hypothetical protein
MLTTNSATDGARGSNILAEVHAGKPNKQAVAIGYAIQRRARARKGK